VLLAVDNAQTLFSISDYLDPLGKPLPSYALSVPRLLLEYISGLKSFVRCLDLPFQHSGYRADRERVCQASGTIMVAPSGTTSKQSRVFDVALGVRPGRPFEKAEDPAYLEYVKGLKAFQVDEKLARSEAAGILKGLQEARLIRGTVSLSLSLSRHIRIRRFRYAELLALFVCRSFGPALFGDIYCHQRECAGARHCMEEELAPFLENGG
jgi:hypothetical protein